MDRMQSPLGRAYGLGSAKEGLRSWWQLRLTSIALIPLGLWWVVSVVAHAHGDYAGFVGWLHGPVTTVLFVVTLVATFHHMSLGLAEVIEDYVAGEFAKLGALIAVRATVVLLGVAAVLAVLRVAFAPV